MGNRRQLTLSAFFNFLTSPGGTRSVAVARGQNRGRHLSQRPPGPPPPGAPPPGAASGPGPLPPLAPPRAANTRPVRVSVSSSVISRFQVTPRGCVTHVIIFPVIIPVSIFSTGSFPISFTVPLILPASSTFRSSMMACGPPRPRPPGPPASGVAGAFFCASSAAGALSVCHFPASLDCP